MKQIEIVTRVYDREQHQYIQRGLTFDLNDEQAEMFENLLKSMRETNLGKGIWGFGAYDKETKCEMGLSDDPYDEEIDGVDNRDEDRPFEHRFLAHDCGIFHLFRYGSK